MPAYPGCPGKRLLNGCLSTGWGQGGQPVWISKRQHGNADPIKRKPTYIRTLSLFRAPTLLAGWQERHLPNIVIDRVVWSIIIISSATMAEPIEMSFGTLTMTFKLVWARNQTRLPCEFGTNLFSHSWDIWLANKNKTEKLSQTEPCLRAVITKELKTKTNLLKKYGLDNSLRGQSWGRKRVWGVRELRIMRVVSQPRNMMWQAQDEMNQTTTSTDILHSTYASPSQHPQLRPGDFVGAKSYCPPVLV